MANVLGVGGVFFKSQDPSALQEWYSRVLGLPFESWGGVVFRPQLAANHPGSATVFAAFESDTKYFAPATNEFMINLMVDDLDGVLRRCAQHGVTPIHRQDEANGRFAHLVDPEGRKLELWEPKPMEG